MEREFHARRRKFTLGLRTLVMGIVNVTPDSFADGGEAFTTESAVQRALEFDHLGADIIDIGGESTRPGSAPLWLDEELRRVIPVIEQLKGHISSAISIDTYKSAVARRAFEAGADIINDISAGRFDTEMAAVAAQFDAGVVLMHIKGTPRDMQINPHYEDLVHEIKSHLMESTERFLAAGVPRQAVVVDPGIGFGKTLDHNLELIRRLGEFQGIGAGVLVGPSRKSFIGLLTGKPVNERLAGTIAALSAAVAAGADIVRVHDVDAAIDAARVLDPILRKAH